jgi:hypothetical protein
MDENGDKAVSLFEEIKYKTQNELYKTKLTVTCFKDNKIETCFEDIRPFPSSDDWFENVWSDFIKKTEK